MNLREFLNVAWESITSNKMRSLLTMLGIIIGVASVIVMVSISAGTEASIEEQITGLGSNLIYVQTSFSRMGARMSAVLEGQDPGGLVYDDAFAIADEVDGVSAVVVEMSSSEVVKNTNATLDGVTIQGTTSDFPSVRDMEIEDGRYFTQREVDRNQKIAVLGHTIAEELFGDADPIGQTITIDGGWTARSTRRRRARSPGVPDPA